MKKRDPKKPTEHLKIKCSSGFPYFFYITLLRVPVLQVVQVVPVVQVFPVLQVFLVLPFLQLLQLRQVLPVRQVPVPGAATFGGSAGFLLFCLFAANHCK